MALSPVANTLGLWQDPNWSPETPGLYALIVGISNYPHLGGGSAQASETFGLGQLEVSARTAAAVFDWLRSDYQYTDLPVVWCYLLLSPSAAEESFLQQEDITHYENPTDCHLRQAIQSWCRCLPTKSTSAGKSRTLFFFSGHGVQSNWDPLLLPADYLFPPNLTPILENCVSTREMKEWMETNPVGEHLAFFDACRNEFSPLATKGSTANRVFPRNPPGPEPKVVATLSATAPNSVAYQSSKVEEFTFFGRALIEGLGGAGRKPTVYKAGALDLEFTDLHKYVIPRIMRILKKYNTTLEQTAKPFLNPCNARLIVTQVRSAAAAPPVRSIARGLSTSIKDPLGPSKAKWPEEAEKIQDSHFNVTAMPNGPLPVSAFRDFPTAHSYFGHEHASELWADVRMYSLLNRDACDDCVYVRGVTRDNESRIVRVDIELIPKEGGILAAFTRTKRGLLAIPLPTDEQHGSVPVRLTLTFDPNPDAYPNFLLGVEGQLGPSTDRYYSKLWEFCGVAKFASFADAAKRVENTPETWDEMREIVANKRMATTAAIAAAIISARGGRIGMLKDWTRNLMNWFPDVPDGAVLWAESLRASIAAGKKKPFGVSDPLGEMVHALGSLERRGVPFFADAFELLDSQIRYLEGRLPSSQLRSLDGVHRMTSRVFQVARPSGQFLMLAALPRPADHGKTDGPLTIEEMLDILRPRAN